MEEGSEGEAETRHGRDQNGETEAEEGETDREERRPGKVNDGTEMGQRETDTRRESCRRQGETEMVEKETRKRQRWEVEDRQKIEGQGHRDSERHTRGDRDT